MNLSMLGKAKATTKVKAKVKAGKAKTTKMRKTRTKAGKAKARYM